MAVICSMLFGSISGSAVANVTTTGTFTIPLMKRLGYTPVFAGAVEAAASTGGQLMPPIMGAAAFLMAEVLGKPYAEIMLAAIIPGLLYYLSVYFVIDLEAAKIGLKGLERKALPKVGKVMKEGWYKLAPLVFLLYMLVYLGTSPMRAALWATLATVPISFLNPIERMGPKRILKALEAGGRGVLTVAMATACAGMIIGAFAITGLGAKLSTIIIAVSEGKVLVILLLTAICSIILGMGLPTVAAYIVLAVLVAPALSNLGVPPLAAHMFIFYFGIISNVTPPVALAAYAASAISGASAMSTGWVATRLAIAGFLIPFVMIYDPSILLLGSPVNIIITSVTTLLGLFAMATGTEGYILGKCQAWERVLLMIAGISLIVPNLLVSLCGFVVLAGLISYQLMRFYVRKPVRSNYGS